MHVRLGWAAVVDRPGVLEMTFKPADGSEPKQFQVRYTVCLFFSGVGKGERGGGTCVRMHHWPIIIIVMRQPPRPLPTAPAMQIRSGRSRRAACSSLVTYPPQHSAAAPQRYLAPCMRACLHGTAREPSLVRPVAAAFHSSGQSTHRAAPPACACTADLPV